MFGGAESKEAEVKILSLTIQCPGRLDLVLPLPFTKTSKSNSLFALREGSRYRLRFSFVVSGNIVSGLKYTNTVWKTGVRGLFSYHWNKLRTFFNLQVFLFNWVGLLWHSGSYKENAGNFQSSKRSLCVWNGRRNYALGHVCKRVVFCKDKGQNLRSFDNNFIF